MADAPPHTSISAAAHAYQLAMSQQQQVSTAPVPVPIPVQVQVPASAATDTIASPHSSSNDVIMNGIIPEIADSPLPGSVNAQSPAPPRTGTPVRSRAASQHPEAAVTLPAEAPLHGASSRQYLNSKVTAVLLEGMKQLAKDQPRDPLRVLGEFLLQRSKEIEV